MEGNETLNLQPSTYCRMTYIKIILKLSEMQGFIEALLLTSVSHDGLSFMEVGHNPMCVSLFSPCSWGGGGGSYGVLYPPSPFVAFPLEALAISLIPGFQIAFPCIIQ